MADESARHYVITLFLGLIITLGIAGCNEVASPDGAHLDGPGQDVVSHNETGRCGEHPWCNSRLSPAERTGLLLQAMTLQDKLSLLSGDDPLGVLTGLPAEGTNKGIPRLGIPDLLMSDGPLGVRGGPATEMPSPLALAATFNPELARSVGAVIGDEIRAKGSDILHGPTVDVMRTPLAGRTFEGYGEDPFLSASMAVPWIRGAQSTGIIATVKHFALNEQEGQLGVPPVTALVGGRQLVDAHVSQRVLHEIYLPPFEAAVRQGHVGAVMCAYNAVNGSPACGNSHLLSEILREGWGFDGMVITDYYLGVKNTANAVNAGTNIEMPIGLFMNPPLLLLALADGEISQATIDQRVGEILRTMFRFGVFDRPAFGRELSTIDKQRHNAVAREVEEQGVVLLKNTGLLPLHAIGIGSVAIIGEPASAPPSGGGSSAVQAFQTVSPLQAIRNRLGKDNVRYYAGNDPAKAASLAADADVVLVFAADQASEGVDKTCLSLDCSITDIPQAVLNANLGLPDTLLAPLINAVGANDIDQLIGPYLGVSYQRQDEIIAAVAAVNPRTVVVLETGGPVLTPWRDSVAALLAAWYPGQAGGPALANILFGDTDPGGRLPVTFPAAENQTPTAGHIKRYPGVLNTTYYTEGVFVGYRWYDEYGKNPAYPFGFGLSYTQFGFADLQVAEPDSGGPLQVSVQVTNIGQRAGWAVPQLYVGLPSPSSDVLQPPKALKGMHKMWLQPGESRRARFTLDDRAMSYWDINSHGWRIAPGCYALLAGRSSRDLPLQMAVTRTAVGWHAGGNCVR